MMRSFLQLPTLLAVGSLLLLASAVDAKGKTRHEKKERNDPNTQTFAIFGDWGRLGGTGAENFKPNSYDPTSPSRCPSSLKDPFYISIDPAIDPGGGPFDKKPDDPCVVSACGSLDGDLRENCEGKIQQLQAAFVLEKSCESKGCEFVLNTSDNFYADGCNDTVSASGGTCAQRFRSDWINVYKTKHTPTLKPLTWYSSLGNHDILSGKAGVESQIRYSKENPDWVLPARYYAKRIGSGKAAINLVVADTNSFIDGYLKNSSAYSLVDEEQEQSTAANRAKQLDFLETALKDASKKEGWTIVMGHHPAFSGDQSYFRDDDTGKPESAAWAKFAELVHTYRPHFYVNGHDHVVCYFNAKQYGYDTQFFTSGAGSFTEPNDGGWDADTGKVRPNKPYMKYSNVRMKDGASFTGNIVATATPNTLTAEMFSAPTGTRAAFVVKCKKGEQYKAGFKCTYGPGPAKPAYSHA